MPGQGGLVAGVILYSVAGELVCFVTEGGFINSWMAFGVAGLL